MPFIYLNLLVASHFTFASRNSQSPDCGLQALCDLPSLYLFSLISLLFHSSHSLWYFVLSVSCTLNELFPDPHMVLSLPFFKSLLKCYFLKEVFPKHLLLSNFLTRTFSLASLFVPLIITWHIIHLCLYSYILFFSNIYILWKQG